MSLNLDKYFPGKSEEFVVDLLYNLYTSGTSTKELGKALDVTDVTIRKYFNKYNLSLKQHGGQYKGKEVKITEEEYKTKSTKELMQEHNCSQFTIYNLTKNYPSKVGRTKRYIKT